LIAAGTSNKEIALQLHLTEKTVKHYVTNILQKLQVQNRVQAAILALKKPACPAALAASTRASAPASSAEKTVRSAPVCWVWGVPW